MGENIERWEVPEGLEVTEREMVLGVNVPAELGGGLGAKLGFHLRSRKVRRAVTFTEDVAEELEVPPEAMLRELNEGGDPKTSLFERALEDAAEIGDDEHRKRLAGVVAHGLRGDTGALDRAEVLRQALRDLKPHDIRVLLAVQKSHSLAMAEHQKGILGPARDVRVREVQPCITRIAEMTGIDIYSVWEIVDPLISGEKARRWLEFDDGPVGADYQFDQLVDFTLSLTSRSRWLLKGLEV